MLYETKFLLQHGQYNFPPKAYLCGKTKYSPVIPGYILYYIIPQKV